MQAYISLICSIIRNVLAGKSFICVIPLLQDYELSRFSLLRFCCWRFCTIPVRTQLQCNWEEYKSPHRWLTLRLCAFLHVQLPIVRYNLLLYERIIKYLCEQWIKKLWSNCILMIHSIIIIILLHRSPLWRK